MIREATARAQGSPTGQEHLDLKLFLSYSRQDEAFARELLAGLELCGFDPFIDKEDIAAGEDWELRLTRLIETADTVVFIISPNSVSSQRCNWEVERSAALNKRILPVVWQRVEEAQVPERLKWLNYIFFDAPHSFGPSLGTLATALRTDLEWLREHTRLGERAAEWELNRRSEERLLRGEALAKAIIWLGSRPTNAPESTTLQRLFLAASEDAEAMRIGLQERQLREMAEAQAAREQALREAETALASARTAQAHVARSQRRNGRLLLGVAVLLAAILGLTLRQQYINSEREARVYTSLASKAVSEERYDAAMRFALQGLPARGSIPGLTYSSPELEAKLAGAAQLSRLEAVLGGHEDVVRRATFDPDGKRVATASRDSFARVWSLASPTTPTHKLKHDEEVNSVAFSPDGSTLLTASGDGKARLWDIATSRPIELPHHKSVQRAVFSPDGTKVLSVSQDETAKLWDRHTGALLMTYAGHGGWVMSGEFSADGKLVVTASADGAARVWPTEGDAAHVTEPLALLRANGMRMDGASFSRDAARVLTFSTDKTTRLWDVRTRREIFPAITHGGGVFHAVFSPDERRIATAAFDGKARISSAANGEQIDRDLGHDGDSTIVYSVAFSRDGRWLVTTAGDAEVRLWDTRTSNLRAKLRGHREVVSTSELSPDGRLLITASGDGTARVWSIAGSEILDVQGYDISFTADHKRAVALADDGSVKIIDAHSGTFVEAKGPRDPRTIFALSADGRAILTGHLDRIVRLWDPADGRAIQSFEWPEAQVTSAAFYGADRILTTHEDTTARLWDRKSGKTVQFLDGHEGRVRQACTAERHGLILTVSEGGSTILWKAGTQERSQPFPPARVCAVSSNGGRIVLGLDDYTLQQWELPSLKALPSFGKTEHEMTTLAFDDSGQRIIAGFTDGRAQLFATASGKLLQTFSIRGQSLHAAEVVVGPGGPAGQEITFAMISENGKRVVTASADETIRIWDTASGAEVAVLRGRGSSVSKAVIGARDTRLVSASVGGAVRLWDVRWAADTFGADLRERVCTSKLVGTAGFTAEEMKDPIMRFVSGQPCSRRGPLSPDYWTGLIQDSLNALLPARKSK